jgi:hypothetical protein
MAHVERAAAGVEGTAPTTPDSVMRGGRAAADAEGVAPTTPDAVMRGGRAGADAEGTAPAESVTPGGRAAAGVVGGGHG